MNKFIKRRQSWGLLAAVLLLYPVLASHSGKVYAQSDTPSTVFRPGVTNFALLGEFEYGADITKNSTTFMSPDLGLMPLYRQGNFFFESGIGFGFDNNGPTFDVGPINLSYMLPNGWLIRVGHFDALPFGRYPRTYDPPWINPFATGPLGFDALGAFSDYGVQLQGSGFLGNMRLRGFVSVTNGPSLSLDPGSEGMLVEPSVVDNNKAKLIGGRLSLSPFLSSNFSIGVSGYTTSNVGNSGSQYDGIGANLFSVDFNVAPTISSLDGFIRLRGELNDEHVDKATYPDETSQFNNNSTALFAMAAYQPSMSGNALLRSTMIEFMYSRVHTPKGANWDLVSASQYDLGLTYWFNWRTNLKFDYDIQQNMPNALMIHVGLEL